MPVAPMNKKYQVFVSSTYEDLREERQHVMQALLSLDCIPSAMELFPASDGTAWELIQKVIDECDYYVVIVAGKYGSLGPDGKSFTQMEYEYAAKRGKPRLAFLHGDPGKLVRDKTETDPEKDAKLKSFRDLLRGNLCKMYSKSEEVAGLVALSMAYLTRTKPAIGWVRADRLVSENAAGEILELRNEVDRLRKQLSIHDTTSLFASGEDQTTFVFHPTRGVAPVTVTMTWDEAFSALADALFWRWPRHHFQGHLANYLRASKSVEVVPNQMAGDAVNRILIQLAALGLVDLFDDSWGLTPRGREKFIQMRAVQRDVAAVGSGGGPPSP